MVVWPIIIGGLFLLFVLVWLWKRVKHIQSNLIQTQKILHLTNIELEIKNKVLETKDKVLEIKDKVLETKDKVLETKDKVLESKKKQIKQQTIDYQKLKTEKSIVEAKLYKKLKAADEKKNNLAKYRQMKKDTRSIKQQAEDIVGKGPKWLRATRSSKVEYRML